MKNNTKIYNRFKGFTLEDCDCRYCLYYGGRRKGQVQWENYTKLFTTTVNFLAAMKNSYYDNAARTSKAVEYGA